VTSYLAVSFLLRPHSSPELEVLAAVSPRTIVSALENAESPEGNRGDRSVNFELSKPARFTVWTQQTYGGPLSPEVVSILIERGRADSLEAHLASGARSALQEWIADAEREIQESALLAWEEWLRVKTLLRRDPTGHVLIHARPAKNDPLWHRVQAERERLKNNSGYVVSDYPNAKAARRGSPRIYYFADYNRWPVLRELDLDFNRAAVNRARAVRRWIKKEYKRRGPRLFDIH
jgi:hypothetical protein